VYEPNEHDKWLEEWRARPFDGAYRPRTDLTSPPRTQSASEIEEDAVKDREARAVARQEEQEAMIRVVLSRMQPGSLAAAARNAARERCAREVGDAAQRACLTQPGVK
jgi:hypothetical protein